MLITKMTSALIICFALAILVAVPGASSSHVAVQRGDDPVPAPPPAGDVVVTPGGFLGPSQIALFARSSGVDQPTAARLVEDAWIYTSGATDDRGPIRPLGECDWRQSTTPAAGDPRLGGQDPTTGVFLVNLCNGQSDVWAFVPITPPPAAGAPAPPPDPAVLAQQAIGQLKVPTPRIGAGPDRTTLAVSLWTWLWVDDPGVLTTTVSAGGISVTATAQLDTTTWNLGEPANDEPPYRPGPPFLLTCDGAGTPPPPNVDWKAEPPCGHRYRWRSDDDRTNGAGAWPIQATTSWNVTWQSNTGVTGATTLTATGADQLDIREYRILLVPPGG